MCRTSPRVMGPAGLFKPNRLIVVWPGMANEMNNQVYTIVDIGVRNSMGRPNLAK